MAERMDTDVEALDQLWSRLDEIRTGMLWVPDSAQHPQPMTHFADPATGVMWFVTSADTDLVGAVGHGAQARFVVQSGKEDYQASLIGTLVVYDSDAVLDRLWSVATAAWFEQGREDPKVTLLQFSPREAAIWASDTNVLRIGAKMVQAALSSDTAEPDIGTHRVLDLSRAA